MRRAPRRGLHLPLALLLLSLGCSGDVDPATVDTDQDSIPDAREDRNGNGQVDPGETDPTTDDTDGDGILDGDEVSTLVCAPDADRPFAVYDVPGADAEVLVDAGVSTWDLLFSRDGRNAGAVFYDPGLDVAGVVLTKTRVGADPAAHRAHELSTALREVGRPGSPRARAFATVQQYAAEQARFEVRVGAAMSAAAYVNAAASEILGGITLQGALPELGTAGEPRHLTICRI